MNILMLGRWLPPPRRPLRGTREYQFARQLASRHRLTLAFTTDNPDARGPISTLRAEFGDLEFAVVPRGWKSLSSAVRLAAGESCTLSYFRSEALRTRLAERLGRTRYDLVFVSASSMIQYALDVDPAISLVVDFGEVDSEWWARQATRGSFPATRFFRTEAIRLRTAEAAAARRAALCLAETPLAAQIVRSLAPSAPTTVIPNGVDVEFFGAALRTGKTPDIVLSIGPNGDAELRDAADFCRHVVPAVRSRMPAARFIVASKDPLTSGRIAAQLVGVEVAAPVSDLRLLLHTQVVGAAPLRNGSDLRSGALEPMAAGVPVVATSTVRDQLAAVDGRDLRVADDPLEFAFHVIQLLESPSARQQMGAQGRRFVQTHFSWDVFAARLGDVLEGALGPITPVPPPGPNPIAAALGG